MNATNTVINSPPKARFQASADNIAKHRHMCEQGEFQRALDFALLEYQRRIQSGGDLNPNNALAGYYRLLGAQELIATLWELGTNQVPTPTVLSRNLDHKA